jgi:hypothetical protein
MFIVLFVGMLLQSTGLFVVGGVGMTGAAFGALRASPQPLSWEVHERVLKTGGETWEVAPNDQVVLDQHVVTTSVGESPTFETRWRVRLRSRWGWVRFGALFVSEPAARQLMEALEASLLL